MQPNIPENSEFENAKFDNAADDAVVKYAEEIRDWIYDFDGSHIGKVSLDENFVSNANRSLLARQYTIRSDFGAVIVLPNFIKKSSPSATILNIGLIRAMLKEGYTLDYIQENGKIYGTMKSYSQDSIELFGYYLTNKI